MKKRILIVEDDSFLMDAYTLKLAQTEYDVMTAEDGQVALRKCQTDTPDLIILDLLMPNMDGLTFLKEYQHLYPERKTPILVATNNDQPEAAQEALDSGACGVFIKSDISIKDLVDKCSKHISS